MAALLGRPHRLALLALVAVAGCSIVSLPSPPLTPKPTYTAAPPTPTLSPIATAGPADHRRPYDAAAILAVLQDVPQTFPAQLRTPEMAQAIADALSAGIWTYDGRPYRELAIRASCGEGGPLRCDLSASGLPASAPTRDAEDAYWWEVTGSGLFRQAGRGLRGYPAALDAELDELARSLDQGRLEGLSLLSVEWALPPPDDGYVLRYGTGREEGARNVFITIDRTARQILEQHEETLGVPSR